MKVLVYGAGCIGGYLGAALMKEGSHQVTFLGRERLAGEYRELGLKLTDYEGREFKLEAPLPCLTSLASLEEQVDLVLLTVKCTGVAQAASELAPWLKADTTLVCLQNGIGSFQEAQRLLPGADIVPGMVPFNVTKPEPGRLHRGTEGELHFLRHPKLAILAQAWEAGGISTTLSESFDSVAWGKLLLNLNNAVNALAGVPLVEQLGQRDYRVVLSQAQRELLAALKVAEIKPAKLTKAPPSLLPWILLLPNWLFRLIARQMLAIDPLARSSMWDDLEQRRHSEIDYLNQAVVDLAGKFHTKASVNAGIVSLVREAESQGRGSPHMSAAELRERVC